MDLKDLVAKNIRRLRHQKELTQEDLSDRSGVSVRYIGKIESTKVSPSVTVLGKLAEALDVLPAVLVSD